jgi:hypothetical protein
MPLRQSARKKEWPLWTRNNRDENEGLPLAQAKTRLINTDEVLLMTAPEVLASNIQLGTILASICSI